MCSIFHSTPRTTRSYIASLYGIYTLPLSAVNGLSRLTTTSNRQARPMQKFLNRPITFKSNQYGLFEFKLNLEASQVLNFVWQFRSGVSNSFGGAGRTARYHSPMCRIVFRDDKMQKLLQMTKL